MIALGQKVKDKVTGFEGIATARVEYLNGCIQYSVRPKMDAKNKEYPDSKYIDEGQLVITGKGISVKKKGTGGVMDEVPSASYQN